MKHESVIWAKVFVHDMSEHVWQNHNNIPVDKTDMIWSHHVSTFLLFVCLHRPKFIELIGDVQYREFAQDLNAKFKELCRKVWNLDRIPYIIGDCLLRMYCHHSFHWASIKVTYCTLAKYMDNS